MAESASDPQPVNAANAGAVTRDWNRDIE
jgi:hypothetical protein